MEDRTKSCNIYLIGVKELQNKKMGGGMYKEVMAKKFPVLKMLLSIFKCSVNYLK